MESPSPLLSALSSTWPAFSGPGGRQRLSSSLPPCWRPSFGTSALAACRADRMRAPRTHVELEEHFARVCAANHVRPPEPIDEAKGCSPVLGLGYANARVLFELVGPDEPGTMEEARKQLAGDGWFIHRLTWD